MEQLDLTDYDLVISSESDSAKGVIIRADTPHALLLPYAHALPLGQLDAISRLIRLHLTRCAMRLLLPGLRRWDVASSFRVDHFVANSHNVARRIRKHWRRDISVVPPPINVETFTAKRALVATTLCLLWPTDGIQKDGHCRSGMHSPESPLLVLGEGEEMDRLKAMAGPTVRFLGRLSDKDVASVLTALEPFFSR